jgi:hypothetical protein
VAKKRMGKFPKAFRQMAVGRLTQCGNIVALAKELGIGRRLLYMWREKLEPLERSEGPPANSREVTLRGRGQPTQAGVGREGPGSRLFQRGRAHRRGATPAAWKRWRAGLDAHIRDVMSGQGHLSIERMCDLAQVSRAGFYRSLRAYHPVEAERDVRSAIQGIAVAHRRRYGDRRITSELRRRGLLINHML